ncbi:hypothetical protein [Novosphingobium sp.]|uniref:hypothetical protein n=1 Tax=Novosphingobium sp. TaxID=1874826 RepID=UPI0031D77E31
MTEKRELGVLKAFWLSLVGRTLDCFPLPEKGGDPDVASPGTIISQIKLSTEKWAGASLPKGYEIDDAINLAKNSLAEVKALTEYQDGKASRLLTVTSFIGALGGVLFNAFIANYPVERMNILSSWGYFLISSTYLSFFLFGLFALSGALVTFHATRTRFKYPKMQMLAGGVPRSFLFYDGIISVPPKDWAESFIQTPPSGAVVQDLRMAYLKNYVSETYLVAAKTADKLRFLEPAQRLLAWSFSALLAFVILFAFSGVSITPIKAPNSAECSSTSN